MKPQICVRQPPPPPVHTKDAFCQSDLTNTEAEFSKPSATTQTDCNSNPPCCLPLPSLPVFRTKLQSLISLKKEIETIIIEMSKFGASDSVQIRETEKSQETSIYVNLETHFARNKSDKKISDGNKNLKDIHEFIIKESRRCNEQNFNETSFDKSGSLETKRQTCVFKGLYFSGHATGNAAIDPIYNKSELKANIKPMEKMTSVNSCVYKYSSNFDEVSDNSEVRNIACKFHLNNKCNRGFSCRFVHSCIHFLNSGSYQNPNCNLPHLRPCQKFNRGVCFSLKCSFLHIRKSHSHQSPHFLAPSFPQKKDKKTPLFSLPTPNSPRQTIVPPFKDFRRQSLTHVSSLAKKVHSLDRTSSHVQPMSTNQTHPFKKIHSLSMSRLP